MAAATVSVSNSTAQRVIDLIQAVTGHSQDQGACTYLNIRGHDTNTGNIYAGDSGLTNTNYGIELPPGESRLWQGTAGLNNVDMLNKFLLASASSQKVDIDWEYA